VPRVKICGVNSAAAFDAAAGAGAAWIGFVFFAGSPRYITPSAAAALSARRPGGPRRVGLFVNPTDDDIASALCAVKLNVLQLYDTADRVDAVAARFNVPVWRSVSVGAASDLPSGPGAAAALVIEPLRPEGATRPGGNAVALDWPMLRGWRPGFPWLLAGGLTPANVAAAIVASGAQAVDVSSGVEVAPGEKSPALISAFIAAAKAGFTPPKRRDPEQSDPPQPRP
jgi:phosphoribosylanthranilate isomerase